MIIFLSSDACGSNRHFYKMVQNLFVKHLPGEYVYAGRRFVGNAGII